MKEKKIVPSWLPVDLLTPDKPEVEQIIDEVDCSKNEAVGALLRLLCWANANCEEDGFTGLSCKALDRKVELAGFAKALVLVGWASLNENDRVIMTNYAEKNSNGARARMQNAKRKARQRTRDEDKEETKKEKEGDENVPSAETCHASTVTQTGQERDASKTEACQMSQNSVSYINSNININTLSSSTSVNKGSEPENLHSVEPARALAEPSNDFAREAFGEWLKPLCALHPAARNLRTLPKDVEQAALATYKTGFVLSEAEVKLLGMYYEAEWTDADERSKLWRPRKLRLYFESLSEVLASAMLWAEKWGKKWKKTPKAKTKAKAEERLKPEQAVSAEEARALLQAGMTAKRG